MADNISKSSGVEAFKGQEKHERFQKAVKALDAIL